MYNPETSTPLLAWLLLGPVVIVGFFGAGHLAFRRLKSPLPWVTAAMGSFLLLFFGVLGFDLLGVPVTARTLGAWLALTSLAGWWLGGRGPIFSGQMHWPRPSWREWWWALPCLVAFGSILVFGVCDPLSGFDNSFRWNYLALVMAHQGSLAHYPPMNAADFRVYPWCDGIPPLVPIANFWIYLGTHSTSGTLIVGRLAVELGLTLGLVWHLARRLWGSTGARVAVLVLSTSSLFGWSIGMEQETGFSGVAALALVALLLAYRDAPATSTAIWIGLTAAVSALCRDYNLIFIPVALIALVCARAPRRHLWLALTVAVLVAAPWYGRNALLTGNPIFPIDLGGLLPTNHVYQDVMKDVRAMWAFSSHRQDYLTLVEVLLTGAGALILLALPAGCSGRFATNLLAVLVLIFTGLWLVSVPYTAGGWFYSVRVLGPALPLLAVASGWWGTRLSGRGLLLLGLALLPLSADAARRSWTFVWDPLEAPWPYTWQDWHSVDNFVQASLRDPLWPALAGAAREDSVAVDGTNAFIMAGRAGARTISIFSPELDLLTRTQSNVDLRQLVRELRRRHVRYVIFSKWGPQPRLFVKRRAGLAALLALEPTIDLRPLVVYDLARLAQPAGPAESQPRPAPATAP